MANYEKLKEAIAEVIKENGNQEITGKILQNTLLSMVNELGGNATFAGVATPETNPGTPDGNVFYLAGTPGTYANFNGIEVGEELAVISNESGSWVKKTFYDTIYSLRKLYETAGAKYNEDTGFYELNGLTDITEAQMRTIYIQTHGVQRMHNRSGVLEGVTTIRTNLPFRNIFGIGLDGEFRSTFLQCSSLEVACVASSVVYAANVSYMFESCLKLKKVIGILDVRNITDSTYVTRIFLGCKLLEYVRIASLKVNISFAQSPLLSLESLQYLINNATNTSAITVTVHADVYAKIQDEGQADWHALIAAGQAKNITFTTA